MVPLCTLLLIAGFETTVNLIGNTTLALLHHPDAWHRVANDPDLAAAAVEETLRYDAPVQRTGRVALQDVEVDGRLIKKDEFVITLLGGANRDPRVFARPGRFDLDRPNSSDHLASPAASTTASAPPWPSSKPPSPSARSPNASVASP